MQPWKLRAITLLTVLLVCTALASPAPARTPAAEPKPRPTSWTQRVRRVWSTHNWAGHSRAEKRKAEQAVLSEGRPRAAAALRPMLRRPFEGPLRLQAAFAMALLDLDYATGRGTLLRYLRALALNRGRVEVDWERLMATVADPEAPYDANIVLPEDVAGLVYAVYERRADPKLLAGLLDLAPYTDGDLSEGMGVMLHEVARQRPRALLAGLQHQPKKVWQSVCFLIGFDLAPDPSARHALPALDRISRNRRDPLHRLAQRLLRGIAEKPAE
jgi:hypothetical protein